MAWRKTFLDKSIESVHVHGVHKKVAGALTGGLIGEDVYGLDITGAGAAGEAALEGTRLSAEAALTAKREEIDFSTWLWGEQKALAQPYADLGTAAIPQYQREVAKGMTLDDVYKDPGYRFGMAEGIKGVETSASARGMQLSGATLKGINRFSTDYASTKYNEAFNRRQVGLDNLYRMIATGQAAAAGQAATGGQMGSQVVGSIREGGRAQSQMYSDVGNIRASQAMAPWNTLMDVSNLGASFYRT